MGKLNDTGIYQMENGYWYYRIKLAADANGNPVDTKKSKDENGQPFKTKSACKRARDKRLVELQTVGEEKREKYSATLQDMWDIFLEKDAQEKAKATVTKYSSVWKNHIKPKYGNKKLKDLSVSDLKVVLNEQLAEGRKYSYVEGFLKLFYLLFGIAYREQKIDSGQYTRMFLDKGTRLSMPPKRVDEEDDDAEGNRVFYKYELKEIFSVVNGTNLQTAFMLGYYCGLRASEAFGIRWSDVDWNKGIIKIRCQLKYEDDCFAIGPVKTLAGYREVEMPTVLQNHLVEKYRIYMQEKDKPSYRNTECVLDKKKVREGVPMIGSDFINRKENGELLTYNSIKYYAMKIKAETSVADFKFHSLRKTHITELAALGTPAHILMRHCGHKKITTTMRYYTEADELSKTKLIANLNQLGTEEPEIETTDAAGNKHVIKEADYIQMLKAKAQIPTIKESRTPYTTMNLAAVPVTTKTAVLAG